MKKILIILLILILISTCKNSGITYAINTSEEQESILNCQNGDKILNYYETKTDMTNPNRYLGAAKYYYYQASRLDLSNPDALIGHARIALHQNKLIDAKNVLMIALNFDETNPKTNFYLGETFYRDGEYSQASDYFENALKYGYGSHFRTNYRLGLCYEKLNDEQKARHYYTNAINISPDSTEVKERLQGLDSINTNYTPHPLNEDDEDINEEIYILLK